ncbi:MAG TPA: M23 family metallopeptidase [Acidobacteriota bacterium]|nr:M23 family metallopeptidase [Acidobacteriota bacterium]
MRSYTVTLRPEGIKGKFRSYTLSGRTILFSLFCLAALIVAAAWAFVSWVIVPYSGVTAAAEKAQGLGAQNAVLESGIAEKRTVMGWLSARVALELALVEKVDTLLGGGEWQSGGYPRLGGDRAQNLLSALSYLERRLENHQRFATIIEQMPIRLPLRGGFDVASSYGTRRSPFNDEIEIHNGIDLSAPEGAVVLASGSGVVSLAGRWEDLRMPDYGRLGLFVRLEHGETGYSTIYGHCSRLLVRQGDRVGAGQPIALVGNTGWSTAPHVHFAVCRGDEYFDPKDYLLYFDTYSIRSELQAGRPER